jgi:hypothetical protein
MAPEPPALHDRYRFKSSSVGKLTSGSANPSVHAAFQIRFGTTTPDGRVKGSDRTAISSSTVRSGIALAVDMVTMELSGKLMVQLNCLEPMVQFQ